MDGRSGSRQILETPRLWLREFNEGDVVAYYALGSNPAVIRYTGAPLLLSVDQALEVLRARPIADYQRYGFGRWACVLKENDQVIGWAGLKFLPESQEVDLGYWLLPEFWGQGLATDAALVCIRFGFERLRLERIVATAHPENSRSLRVLGKVGMRRMSTVLIGADEFIKFEIPPRTDRWRAEEIAFRVADQSPPH